MPVTEKFRLFSPRAQVTFYHPVAEGERVVQTELGTSTVLTLNTSKRLYGGQGGFQLTMKLFDSNGKRWLDVLSPNDKAVIRLSNGGVTETVMVGLIDAIRENEAIQNDAMRRTCSIVGTDYVKLFQQYRISYSFLVNEAGDVFKGFAMRGWEIGPTGKDGRVLTNGETLGKILDWIAAKRLSDLHFGLISDEVARDITASEQIYASTWVNYQGDLWGMLSQVASPPFNELFLDTIKGQPTIVFRSSPFSDYYMTKLPMHQIAAEEWSQRSLGKSDGEVKNLFLVYIKPPLSGMEITRRPTVLVSSIKRFGLRDLRLTTNLSPFRNCQRAEAEDKNPKKGELREDAKDNEDRMTQWQGELAGWFGSMEKMLSGVVTLRGRPEVHIGQTVKFDDRPELFYVTEVHHEYQVKRRYATHLVLSRGKKYGQTNG